MGHCEIAAEIGRAIVDGGCSAVLVRQCGRQGDVIVRRLGDASVGGEATIEGGIVVAAGAHGEHRLIADAAVVEGGRVSLPTGGLLVHTDQPSARHGALELAPGQWEILRERELSMSDSIVEVKD
jgi:hypothetical protein